METTRRDSLKKIGRLKRRKDLQDFVDYDYLDKLSNKDLAYLAEFSDDHYDGPGSGRKRLRNGVEAMGMRSKDEPITLDSITPEMVLDLQQQLSAASEPKTRKRRNRQYSAMN